MKKALVLAVALMMIMGSVAAYAGGEKGCSDTKGTGSSGGGVQDTYDWISSWSWSGN